MSLRLKLLILLIPVVIVTSVILDYFCHTYQFLDAGQLIILAITLIFVIKYAWDTHRIANATEQKWEEELRPKLMYEMGIDQAEKQSEIVYFKLINPTDYMIEAKVNCNFKIYGESVRYAGGYDGTEIWRVFPHQICQGYFLIDTLLCKKGKTRIQMIEERNDSNAIEQLTMDLEISFENETGRKKGYPARRHYFAFDRWTWIPVLTKFE